MFALHPQLEKDGIWLGDWPLCRVLLMDNAEFPWVILVPRREGVREVTDLDAPTRVALMEELCRASEAMQKLFKADKMNVAALGNMVPQLHVHVIARFSDDAAWPKPVWGGPARPYGEAMRAETVAKIQKAFAF